MVVLRELPKRAKDALEHRSLDLLSDVTEDIVVIGGWAARAWSGRKHIRYTYDIDGVADERGLERAHEKLTDLRLSPQKTEWGYIYTAPSRVPGAPEGLLIKIELSLPRIYDIDGLHYFEFDPKRSEQKTIETVDGESKLKIRVPEIWYLAANKLGLEASFGNEYDLGSLLRLCDTQKLVAIIKAIDRWRERVLERAPKMLNHLRDPDSISRRALLKTTQIEEIDQSCQRLEEVLTALRRKPVVK